MTQEKVELTESRIREIVREEIRRARKEETSLYMEAVLGAQAAQSLGGEDFVPQGQRTVHEDVLKTP